MVYKTEAEALAKRADVSRFIVDALKERQKPEVYKAREWDNRYTNAWRRLPIGHELSEILREEYRHSRGHLFCCEFPWNQGLYDLVQDGIVTEYKLNDEWKIIYLN